MIGFSLFLTKFAEKFNANVMNYFAATFKITCNEELLQPSRELLADALAEAGFESFEDTEDGIVGYVQTDLLDKVRLEQAISEFPISEAVINYNIEKAEQKDWNETWEMEGFDPIFIGDQCVIYDARQQGNTPLSSLIAPLRIGIETRMAFGTGTHSTTRLVVATLLKLDLKDKRVLDCGCGTGILGIVASKCGAKEVVGYDIDEWSVENSLHNATLNQVENMEVLQGDSRVLSHVSGVFNVIVANINRNVLLADMGHFCDVMASNGVLILSGFYDADCPQLIGEATKHGLQLISTSSENGWSCIVFHK